MSNWLKVGGTSMMMSSFRSDVHHPALLQIRGSLKSWTRLWCALKPGVLLIYKTPKADHWVGTILLSACKLIERPSKKDGFCFKLYHPLEKSIWAVKVPNLLRPRQRQGLLHSSVRGV